MHVAEPRALVVAAAVLFGGVYFAQVHQEQARSDCQAKINHAFIGAIGARSGPSDARVDALDALLSGISVLVLNPPMTAADKARAEKATRTLFGDYANAAAAFRQTKATSPLPVNTPKCGG